MSSPTDTPLPSPRRRLRAALPLALVLLGVAAVVYGGWFRSLEVLEDKEREISIFVPPALGGSAPFDLPLPNSSSDRDAADEESSADKGPSSGNPFEPSMPNESAAKDAGENPIAPQDKPASAAADSGNPFESSSSDEQERPGDARDPFAADALAKETVVERYTVAVADPEWRLVREATFGGITRLENGELKRTYSGKPPALCPT